MDAASRETPTESVDLQRFLQYLASALTHAGEAVNEIQNHLDTVARAYGAFDARIAVLPTFVVVSLDPTQPATLEPTRQLAGSFRLDQVSALYQILDCAKRREFDALEGCRRVLAVVAMPPRFGPARSVLAQAVLAVGICLILQPSWGDLFLAAVFGAALGVLRLFGERWVRAQMVMPAVAALLVSTLTFWMAQHHWLDADLRAMIAPLVTFLPGAALTIAVVELSAAEMVTGASRLVSGGLQLVLLGFGIVGGAEIVGVNTTSELVNSPHNLLGWWAPWMGLVVFAIGVYVYYSAPRRTFFWLLVVLLSAWLGQQLGSLVFGGYLSGFFGALAMTVMAKSLERFPSAPPALVSFLPGFWLLVPGALGLIGVTEYLSDDSIAGIQDFLGTLSAIVSIALGVLCGYPLVTYVTDRYRQVSSLIWRDPNPPAG